MVHKALHRELMIEKHVPTKTRDELSCCGGKNSACSKFGTRPVIHIIKPMKSKEDWIVTTTIGTYPCLSVTQVSVCTTNQMMIYMFQVLVSRDNIYTCH